MMNCGQQQLPAPSQHIVKCSSTFHFDNLNALGRAWVLRNRTLLDRFSHKTQERERTLLMITSCFSQFQAQGRDCMSFAITLRAQSPEWSVTEPSSTSNTRCAAFD